PRVLMIGFAVIMLSGLIRVIANLVTLPVEFDASYNRALPVLATGYIPPDDQDAARQILRAAALTYVASALVSVLNVMRFLRWLR
ncbi:MAG: zinc metallopeptidase, partial [Alphaproteobacteria bacterium]